MVEAVSLDGGQLVLVLLNDFLQSAVQVLLLLLEKLLFLKQMQVLKLYLQGLCDIIVTSVVNSNESRNQSI